MFLVTVSFCSDLTHDSESRELRSGSRTVVLSRSQSSMIGHLMRVAGRLLTRDALMGLMYEHSADPATEKILDVWICILRGRLRALGSEVQIQTVWGSGYRLLSSTVTAPTSEELRGSLSWAMDQLHRLSPGLARSSPAWGVHERISL